MRRIYKDKLSVGLLWLCGLLSLAFLLLVVGYIFVRGVGAISWEFLTAPPRLMGKEGGIWPSIVSTVYLVTLSLLFASPVGVGAAIYFFEYAKNKRVIRYLRFATEILAAVPSILFGLFGFSFFVNFLGLGWSVLSGSLTLALMILPTIQRTAEEALASVPKSYIEGSLALGATRWQTMVQVVLPAATSGIITGIILAVGRSIGETAAVLLTAGSSLATPNSLFSPARSLSVHLFILATEGISNQRAYATSLLLIVLVFLINILANQLRRRLSRRSA